MFWHHAIFLRCNHDLMNLQDPFTADSLRREDGPVAIDDDELNRIVMFEPVKFSNRDGSASVGVADDLNTAQSSSDRVFSECRKKCLVSEQMLLRRMGFDSSKPELIFVH